MKTTRRRVPPAPDVMVRLYMDYMNSGFKGSFKKYLESIGFTDPAEDQIGMDDSALIKRTHLACRRTVRSKRSCITRLTPIQADGKHNLEDPDDWNEGDAGDPFAGKAKVTKLGESGKISTSFGRAKSGISLSNIKRNPDTGVITVKVTVKKK